MNIKIIKSIFYNYEFNILLLLLLLLLLYNVVFLGRKKNSAWVTT